MDAHSSWFCATRRQMYVAAYRVQPAEDGFSLTTYSYLRHRVEAALEEI